MMARAPILLVGGSGQVGTALRRADWPPGFELVALSRSEVDLRMAGSIAGAVRARRWAAVINAAAFTAVDRAESEIETCWQVNAVAPALLAVEAAAAGIPLVHLSTDFVFDGTKGAAYEAGDPACPLSVYGASKAAAEIAIRACHPRHVILRTSWLFGPDEANFVRTMLRLAETRSSIDVVADQRGTPTSAPDLALALRTILTRLVEDPGAPTGTFHFANAGSASWAELAEAVMEEAAARGAAAARVRRIGAAEWRAPARRPADSRLASSTLGVAYGIAPREWRAALGDALDAMPGLARRRREGWAA